MINGFSLNLGSRFAAGPPVQLYRGIIAHGIIKTDKTVA
jgi:hypothetical protein